MTDLDSTPIHLFPLHFEHAARLRSVWRTGGFLGRALQRIQERVAFHRFLMGAIVKQLRHLASVRELALRSEASDAKLLLPAMLENTLSVGFVTKPKWEHVSGKKKTPLTQDLRALMVMAHPFFEQTRIVEQFKGKSQDPIVLLAKRSNASELDVRSQLGKDATKILESEPFTFSGLTLGELAEKHGNESLQWYNSFFGGLLDYTHGPNPLDGLFPQGNDVEANWQSDREEIRLVLEGALRLTHALFAYIDKACDLGYGPSELLKNLAKEFENL